jgi:outer membrane protein assembly factor BamB
VHDFAESVVKLDPAGGLKLFDWYTPGNWAQLDAQDMDLASSGPLLIPGTNLLAGGGKSGEFYLLNSASLGKYNAQDAQVVQKLRVSNGEIRGGAVYWQRSAANGGPLLFVWGQGDRLKAYPFNGQRLAAAPMAQASYANELFPGGILTLSANGDAASSGILWAATAASGDAADNPPVTGVLHAFKAANVAEELWNTNMVPARDGFGGLAKFVPPVVANGKVYLASWSNQVAVYGLLH